MDILGQALLDYQAGRYTEDIITFSSVAGQDVLPLPYLFRDFEDMPELEQTALHLVKGKVLDIGCGAGGHSLWLQKRGYDVTALDSSVGAVKVCHERGVGKVEHRSILEYHNAQFDTLLLMMNGLGLAGKLKQLPHFLQHLKTLLDHKGQILLDSSDIRYMYDKDPDGGYWVPGDLGYYGEVRFYMVYKGKKGMLFNWLYVDFNTLTTFAEQEGFSCELVCGGMHYDYLARLALTEY